MAHAVALEEVPAESLSLGDWIGFAAMAVGIFIAILDIQIVASSLTQIQAGLSATRDEITWVTTSYLIAEVVVIPLSGWLTRAFSTRYLFALAAAGFTGMSGLCALAWNLESMIVFRALQGLFGGVMIPTVFAVIYTMFPPRLQTPITVLVGLIVTIAPTAGPVLGGYLTETMSWHALFLVNLVPGALITLGTLVFVHVDRPDWSLLRQIDFPGALLVVLFLGSLQYVLEEGVREQWFESHEIVLLTAVAVVSGLLMVWRELTIDEPIVDLRAFRDRNFTVGCIYSFVLGIGIYTVLYVLPVYLAGVKGLNSLQIGQYLAVTGAFQFASAFCAGLAARRMDSRVMLALGLAVYGFGAWLNGGMDHTWGFRELFLPQALRGFSMMFIFLPINALALGTLPPEEVKNASGLYNLMRNLGGAIGLAVTNTFIVHWQKAHYASLREAVTAADPGVLQHWAQSAAGALSHQNPDPGLAAWAQLSRVLWREADVMTFNQVFQGMGLLFCASLLLMPLVRKVDMSSGGAGH
ncbi:MAG: DHA2 family efflux MFS transporter permease subunit [Gammaproteobacteria bacterium]